MTERLPYLVAEEHINKSKVKDSALAPYDGEAEKCIYHFAIGDFWNIIRKFLREEEKEDAIFTLQSEIWPLRLSEEEIKYFALVAEVFPKEKRDYSKRWEDYVEAVKLVEKGE